MKDVLIIGGGLAGLACALSLQKAGVSWRLIEASEAPGGRVRTDAYQGFLLDRGFQIFLTAYPSARQLLDYQALDLKAFYPGALLKDSSGLHALGDPLRKPDDIWDTLFNPFATLEDKALILKLRAETVLGAAEDLLQGPEIPIYLYLRQYGFSERFIRGFFQPFLSGVFFDPQLETNHRVFRFLFRMFGTGQAAVPAQGMGAIPQQLFQQLDPERIRFQAPVQKIFSGGVELTNGESLTASEVVLATDPLQAARLSRQIPPRRMRGGLTLYFSTPVSPVSEPILILNSSGEGPVNHMLALSLAAPAYAPPGQHLLALVVLPPRAEQSLPTLLPEVEQQMSTWFGSDVQHWQFLKAYALLEALPDQAPPFLQSRHQRRQLAPGLWLCGDHTETGSIHGALNSGLKLAEQLIRCL
jgi:phytoene dehydrogenase-like protein